MKELLKKNKLSFTIFLIYVGLLIFQKEKAFLAFGNSTYYLIEMAQILPVIFMLTVAIDVLIPKEWIVKRLGGESGFKGSILALAFGSLSAGPIYAAFPIVKILHKKGASIGNVVIILSAWAVIKVPMLANEAKFLGPRFMALRWILTVIFIFAIGLIMQKSKIKIKDTEVPSNKVVSIKNEYCIGCTACKKEMPDIFDMEDGKAIVIQVNKNIESFDEDKKNQLLNIANKCPTKAIEINV